MNDAGALAGRTGRGIALIRLLLLVLAGLMAWWLGQRQTEFGELYAEAVIGKRSDLKLGYIDFEEQIAQVQFQLTKIPEGGVAEVTFVSKLGDDLKSVFCEFVSKAKFGDDLEIPLLHVGVRYDADDHSGWVLSHRYSINTCATSS
ncbi:MAG: hypothetical protein ACLGGY_00350 [Gammaproteobacteria bacterium]